jgi:CHAD domain-containing protein
VRAGVRAALQAQYKELLDHDPGSRLGVDPEDVHKQRVAVRRLRAQLRAGRPVLDRQWADELRGSLKPVGRVLGQVRDLDVLLARIEEQAEGLPALERSGATDVLDRLRADRDAAHADMVERLSEPWYVALLNRLEQAVDAPAFDGRGSLRKRLKKEHRRMDRMIRDLPAVPTDRQLHEVRIAGKRVRYAAELASASGTRRLKRPIKRAKQLQDVLGEHQDAVVAEERLREMEVGRPAARLAVEALLELQETRKAEARAQAPRAWRRLDKALKQ